MAGMLGKSGKWWCTRGPRIGGLRVMGRKARRIGRAREKEQLRRSGDTANSRQH